MVVFVLQVRGVSAADSRLSSLHTIEDISSSAVFIVVLQARGVAAAGTAIPYSCMRNSYVIFLHVSVLISIMVSC